MYHRKNKQVRVGSKQIRFENKLSDVGLGLTNEEVAKTTGVITGTIQFIANPIVGITTLLSSFLNLFKSKADADREARIAVFREKFPAFVNYFNSIVAGMEKAGYGGKLTSANLYSTTVTPDPKVLKLKQIIYMIEQYAFRYWNLYKDNGSLTEKCLAYDWLYAQPNVLNTTKPYPAFYNLWASIVGSDLFTELERAYKNTDISGLLWALEKTTGGGGSGGSSNKKASGLENYIKIGGIVIVVGALVTLTTVIIKKKKAEGVKQNV